MLRSLLLATLLGCSGEDDGDVLDPPSTDLDGDGFGGAADCDDGSAAIYPGADEACNGLDDDCNGAIDDSPEGGDVYYQDEDGDGYGDDASAVTACSPATGLVTAGGDCDDGDEAIHPGAMESCDGRDDDCDGVIDDDSEGCSWYFPDNDGDGLGAEDGGACLCASDADHPTTSSNDCDDANARVNPDAAEVCGDGLDNDCDGGSGDCGLWSATSFSDASATLVGAAAGDKAGWSVAVADVDGDGVSDVVTGAIEADDGSLAQVGALHVALGPLEGTLDLGGADATLYGRDLMAGQGIAAADADGDGLAEIAVGISSSSDDPAVYLLDWPFPADALPDAAALILTDPYGIGEASLFADVDGDGIGDLVSTVYPVSGNGDLALAAFLLPDAGDRASTDADVALSVEDADNRPRSLGSGDLDGDGTDDIALGQPNAAFAGYGAGRVSVVLGPLESGAAEDADLVIEGVTDEQHLGAKVALGDPDGDGYDDIAVGAYGDGTAWQGAVYVLDGGSRGTVALRAAVATLYGEGDEAMVGDYALVAHDIDDDGLSDLVIGAMDDGVGAGLVYLVRGPVSGTRSLAESDARLEGGDAGDVVGKSCAVGDVDSNGAEDLACGAPQDEEGGENAGAVFVMSGAGI